MQFGNLSSRLQNPHSCLLQWSHAFIRLRQNKLVVILLAGICLLLLNQGFINSEIKSGAPVTKDDLIQISVSDVVQSLNPVEILCDVAGADDKVVEKVRSQMARDLSDESVLKRSSHCQSYFGKFVDLLRPEHALIQNDNFNQNLKSLFQRKYNQSEIPVRLAFSILVHTNVGIFETLLQMIFQPYHSYCIHIDTKSSEVLRKAVTNIIRCFQETFPKTQIFLADFPISVYWGHISMVDAELQCLQLLYDRDPHWQYYLNLAGSEMPLVSMSEIEKILSTGHVPNIIQTYPMPQFHIERYKFSHTLAERPKDQSLWEKLGLVTRHDDGSYNLIPFPTNIQKRPPPFNLTIYKGQKNVVLTRKFANFILHHPVAVGFRRWCDDMLIPDESFYSTLVHIKKISMKEGINERNISYEQSTSTLLDLIEDTYIVEQDREARKLGCANGYCIRRSLWDYAECKGQLRREICNLSVEDLPVAVNQPCERRPGWYPSFFINKLDLDVDPLAVQCLAQHVLATQNEPAKNCSVG